MTSDLIHPIMQLDLKPKANACEAHNFAEIIQVVNFKTQPSNAAKLKILSERKIG